MLAAGALVLAACGDDGNAGGEDLPVGNTSGAGLRASVEDLQLEPLFDDSQAAASEASPEVLGDLLGDKPVVVNFFSSSCAPCIEEMPDFEKVHQDVEAEVNFIGLAYMEGDALSQEMVEATGVTYPTFKDPNGDALLFFEGVGLPTTVFIAPDGEIVKRHGGQLSESELRREIDDLLAA
jgi:thiol-disulfide isomerase/thioredoxin